MGIRAVSALLTLVMLGAGCSSRGETSGQSGVEADRPASTDTTIDGVDTTAIEEYPDAQKRALDRRAREPRPVPNSALPPRHLNAELWPELLVERNEIVSGGPPPDGIPSIDNPQFESVNEIDWLDDQEPVAVVTLGDTSRIYPLQVLIWHEIVNDEIDGQPVVVTYCPLCNSVIAFEREVDGVVLDFGTSGALYRSALVMYDRQTESLWTHFDGRSVVGDLISTQLRLIPAATLSWADARSAFPEALVLNRDTGVNAPYGKSPYPSYEAFVIPKRNHGPGADGRLVEQQRVVGLGEVDSFLAIDAALLRDERVVEVDFEGQSVVAFWKSGTSSAVDGERVNEGLDVGATGVFVAVVDGQPTSFSLAPGGDAFIDDATGSTWSIAGESIDGPLAGTWLEPVVHLDTFWFAWVRYHPTTELVS